MSMSSQFTGVVRSVNEKGLKLEGHESWFNVSKYAVGVVLPERGETVTCTLDKAGFLRCVELVEGALPRIAGGSDAVRPSSKDRTITRLAVLKAAAEYAASKPQSSSADVLKIAAAWETWVTREDDVGAADIPAVERPADTLTDAF
jgi:hypothetical protein